jgi:hypothetical protein
VVKALANAPCCACEVCAQLSPRHWPCSAAAFARSGTPLHCRHDSSDAALVGDTATCINGSACVRAPPKAATWQPQ